jgi:hypothetical protein
MSTDTNGLATRPDQVGKIHTKGTKAEWFSTDSFAAPSFGFFGNASNGSIREPSLKALNVSLYKTFPIVERLNLQFRVEAFNVLNHPSFADVDTAYGDGNYGAVDTAHDPRELELALKLNF